MMIWPFILHLDILPDLILMRTQKKNLSCVICWLCNLGRVFTPFYFSFLSLK